MRTVFDGIPHFLPKAQGPVVAGHLGCPVGSLMLKEGSEAAGILLAGMIALFVPGKLAIRKAFLYNVASSLAAVAGGLAAYLWVSGVRAIAPHVMVFSAAGFLYIALADLIPGHRRETNLKSAFQQVALILAGIAAIHLLQGKGA